MQKGLILDMGYYGRYTAAYSIGCLLMLSLYIAGIFLHWAAFGVLLVLTLAGVMLLAVICSVLGTRRFNAAYQRFLTSCDAAAFLAEIRGCQRWQNRSTRPNLALNESFALQALGRGPEALEALSRMGMDRVPRRSKSYLQQLRLSVYTRQASIAIGLEDYAAARSQLAYLRDEVRTLPAGNALFGHFSKAVLDLEHMMAVQRGEPGGHTAYFRTELGLAPNSYLRAQASYYLACALLLEENDAAGAVPLYEQARALAPQLWVAARAGAALNALHAQEAAQPSAGI